MAKLRDIEKHTQRQVPQLHAGHHLSARVGPGRRRGQAGLAVRRSGRCDQERPQHPDHQRPRAWTRDAGRDPGAAGAVGDPPAPGARGPAHHGRPGGRDRLGARSAPLRACSPATARKPCTPTSRWRRWSSLPQGPAGRPVGREGDLQLRQGDRQGPVEDHVEDGRVAPTCRYCGAQLFEAIGLNSDTGRQVLHAAPPASVEGIGVFEIAEEAIRMHKRRVRRRPGARRRCSTPAANTPGACAAKSTCGRPTRSPSCSTARAPTTSNTYKEYAQIINDQSRRHMTLRGLFEFKVDPAKAIPLDEVEPAKEIVKRFATGAMSLGSISHRSARHAGHRDEPHRRQEQHRRRRRGPGALPPGAQGHPDQAGPDAWRDVIGKDVVEVDYPAASTATRCARSIKQVASGRFGVTAEYLSSADQIQIKMAQGAKPGEGGQLPGGKVVRVHRQAALLGAGRRPDLAAAAPRHLLDRGPGAADPRPEERRTPHAVDQRQAGVRSRRRHGRRRRGQVQGRPRRDRRPRRRHRRLALVVDQACRHARGSSAWPRRSRRWC